VLDPAPVIAMLTAVLDFTRLERTLVLGVTNLSRARPEAFCFFPPSAAAFEDDFIAAEPTSVPLRADNYLPSILASAAIPLAFPKVPLADRDGVVCDYIDGGVGNNTPIRQAIDAGADEVTVVIADHLALRDREHRFDDLGSIALVAQDILQQQVLELDLKLTRRVNEAVRRGAAPGKRYVRVRTIGPSVAIPLPILGFADIATIDRAFDQGLIDGRGACDATGLSNLFATDPAARRFAAGDRLFTEGDPGDEMFVIVEGEITISMGGRTIGSAATGDVVGELALLGSTTRRVGALAATDVVVAPVDRDRFAYLVRYAPSFALIVLRALAEILHHMGPVPDPASEPGAQRSPNGARPKLRLEAFRNDPALRSFAAGETIFGEGDPATALYLVLDGTVDVCGDGPSRRASAGDFFGEMALCDCEPHKAEAVAVTAAQVVPIDVMRFTSIVQDDPSFAIDVMHALAERILSRFEAAPV
jgi:CRP-like cAMP-binding protein